MTDLPGQARHAAAPRRNHSKPVIGALATVLAIWLGLTAPSVSPVAPAPRVAPAVVVQQVAPVPGNQDRIDQTLGFDGRGGGGRR